jgi:D-3-phosphoglycerate dehydrogenase
MVKEKPRVLISSKSFGRAQSDAVNLIKKEGINPILNPYGRKLTEQEIIEMTSDVVGIIAGTEKITGKIISNANNLKVISRYGAGVDNIDLRTAKEKNVLVYNTPESPALAVAELTISLMLNILRKTNTTDRNIRKGQWKPEIGNLLTGKTVGLLGLGRIGKKVVQFLEPFNVNILVFEKVIDKEFVSKYNLDVVSLDELIEKSDIISIHLPSTEETRHIINDKNLSKMKKSAHIINTARGDLIDEKALYDALKNKNIAGAAVDVYEKEPYGGILKELDNVILTPHIGSSTFETRKNMDIEAVENLINGLKKVNVI